MAFEHNNLISFIIIRHTHTHTHTHRKRCIILKLSLFYLTTLHRFLPLIRCVGGRSDEWDTLIRGTSRQEVTTDSCHIK